MDDDNHDPSSPPHEPAARGVTTTRSLPITHLLYLHGFRSSPASAKARQTLTWLATHAPSVHCACPQLPPSPAQAFDLARTQVHAWLQAGASAAQVGVVGSSLGGFYATRLAEEFGCRAVLVNPAVDPARLLAQHIGEQRSFHGDEVFFFRPEFIDELRALHPGPLREPQRLLVFVAEGDEVLSWQEMALRYAQAQLRVLPGGDHALSDYPRHLPQAMAWLGLGA